VARKGSQQAPKLLGAFPRVKLSFANSYECAEGAADQNKRSQPPDQARNWGTKQPAAIIFFFGLLSLRRIRHYGSQAHEISAKYTKPRTNLPWWWLL